MSKAFAGFLLALSVFLLFISLALSERTPHPLFMLLWVLVGGYSIYKLCAGPSRAA